jgi:hypothetical protein
MLAQTDDVFEPRFRSCDREGDRALNHVRIVRWTIIGALNVLQRIGDALDVVISATAMSAPSTARCGASSLGAPWRGRDKPAFSSSVTTTLPVFPVAPVTIILGLIMIISCAVRAEKKEYSSYGTGRRVRLRVCR